MVVLRRAQSLCVSSGQNLLPAFPPASAGRLKVYDLALQLPRTAANSNFANQQHLLNDLQNP
jgi:hypothetical protein